MSKIKNKREYEIISNSNLFHNQWFLNKYELGKDVDPIQYYLEFGVKYGLNPTPFFDTSFYLNKYKDVNKSGMNPFVHYIKYGLKEGRLSSDNVKNDYNTFKKYNLYNDYNVSFFKRYDDLFIDFNKPNFKNKVNVGIFLKSKNEEFFPTGYIRLIIPFYHIAIKKNINPYIFYGEDFDRIKNNSLFLNFKFFDVIIVQRDCLDEATAMFLVDLCKLHDIKLIYEIDDDLLGIGESHPDYNDLLPKKQIISYLIENSDCVTVSTINLKDKLISLNPNVKVIKNCLNNLLMNIEKSKNFSNSIKIGYMGSFTHENDIKIVDVAIEKVKRYFLNKNIDVSFEVIGITNKKINVAKNIYIPKDSSSYINFIKWFKQVANWDIAIAPLEDSDLNQSKSEIKFLEYSSLGIPGIFSNIGAYSEVIENFENGILIYENSVEEWESNLKNLIENSLLRKKIGDNAYNYVNQNYSSELYVDLWSEVFKDVLCEEKFNLFNKVNDKPLLINSSFKKDYDLILNSDLFDYDYYYDRYIDVKENNLDAIYHYLSLGVFENCNPSPLFNSKEYINENNINIDEINPFVHYINYNLPVFNFKSLAENSIEDILTHLDKEISIIIPIFNAYEDTKRCIESIFENETKKFNLILINDASTDVRIKELLDHYKFYPNVKVINNIFNKGFVYSVNKGLRHSGNDDVILLNSDTIVTSRWLEKLIIAAYSEKNIGTVTPFSNNAGAFSVPKINMENIIPDDLNLNSMANIIEKVSNHNYISVPTGNGFCLYIKRNAIDSIGFFDEETFGRGYGEENDFCMRLIENGWKNIIDDSTYIFHNKGASFSNERDSLIDNHGQILNERYPNYRNLVERFLNSKELSDMHKNIKKGLSNYSSKNYDKKRILFVLKGNIYNFFEENEFIYQMEDLDYYILNVQNDLMSIYHFINNNLFKIKEYKIHNDNNRDKSLKYVYFNILFNFKIDILNFAYINNNSNLNTVANKLGIPIYALENISTNEKYNKDS